MGVTATRVVKYIRKGDNGVSYAIVTSTDILNRNSVGEYNPAGFSWHIVRMNGDAVEIIDHAHRTLLTAYGLTMYLCTEYADGTSTRSQTPAFVAPPLLPEMEVTSITVELVKGGIIIANKTVGVTNDGTNGEDAISIFVAPESMVMAPNTTYRIAVTAYRGKTRLTYQTDFLCSILGGGGKIDNNDNLIWTFQIADDGKTFYYLIRWKGGEPVSLQVPFNVTINGTPNTEIPKSLNLVSASKNGITYNIISSADAIYKSVNGTLTPTSISWHISRNDGENVVLINTAELLETYGLSILADYELTSSSVSLGATFNPTVGANAKNLRLRVYSGDTEVAQKVLPVIAQGDSGISYNIITSVDNMSKDAAGNVTPANITWSIVRLQDNNAVNINTAALLTQYGLTIGIDRISTFATSVRDPGFTLQTFNTMKAAVFHVYKNSVEIARKYVGLTTDGHKGDRGPTLRGPQAWSDLTNGYSFQAGGNDEDFIDVVLYSGHYYLCKNSHEKSASNYPGSTTDTNSTLWELAFEKGLVATKILLSEYALVDNLGVKAIEMLDGNGLPLFVAKDGAVTCKTGTFENVTVSGTVNASAGTFNGILKSSLFYGATKVLPMQGTYTINPATEPYNWFITENLTGALYINLPNAVTYDGLELTFYIRHDGNYPMDRTASIKCATQKLYVPMNLAVAKDTANNTYSVKKSNVLYGNGSNYYYELLTNQFVKIKAMGGAWYAIDGVWTGV